MSERLLTAAELAERLAVPKTWILESARSGAMPCVRLGRYVRFDIEDVEGGSRAVSSQAGLSCFEETSQEALDD